MSLGMLGPGRRLGEKRVRIPATCAICQKAYEDKLR